MKLRIQIYNIAKAMSRVWAIIFHLNLSKQKSHTPEDMALFSFPVNSNNELTKIHFGPTTDYSQKLPSA